MSDSNLDLDLDLVVPQRSVMVRISGRPIPIQVPYEYTLLEILEAGKAEYFRLHQITPAVIVPSIDNYHYSVIHANGDSMFKVGEKVTSGDATFPDHYKQIILAVFVVKSSAGSKDDDGTFKFNISGSGRAGLRALLSLIGNPKGTVAIQETSEVYDVDASDVSQVPYESSLLDYNKVPTDVDETHFVSTHIEAGENVNAVKVTRVKGKEKVNKSELPTKNEVESISLDELYEDFK